MPRYPAPPYARSPRRNPTDKRLKYAFDMIDRAFPDAEEDRVILKKQILRSVFLSIGLDEEADLLHLPSEEEYINRAINLYEQLKKTSVVDGNIPWLAQKLIREMKIARGLIQGRLTAIHYEDIAKRFLAVCMWAKDTGTDLGSLSLEEIGRAHV